jgi:Cu/Ag efflux protein CusF
MEAQMKEQPARWSVVIVAVIALSVSIASAQQPGAKEHEFKGKIEKVDAKAKTVTVNGENVPGWMGAMTMTYSVDKEAVLSTIKVGDQITAKVYDGDFKTLHDVKTVPPKDAKTPQKK